ncbi:cytochrome P450 [Trametopsis cervina]|nr:cytochrome P450 [Trametopsis cervina]
MGTDSIVALSACLGAAIIALSSIYRILTDRLSLNSLPGPPAPSWLWGNSVDLRKAVVGTRYNVWRQKYGATYKIRGVFMSPTLIVGDPKGITHVLTTKAAVYQRPELDRIALGLWFGKSILTDEGEEHRAHRKILNRAFTQQSVQEVSHVFFDLAHKLCSQWENRIGSDQSATFNVAKDVHSLTLDAISMTMFAHNLSDSNGHIPELLDNIANGPAENDSAFARVMGVLVATFPVLLQLPNPVSKWAKMLRTELGQIARKAWTDKLKAGGDMNAKVLELLGDHEDSFTEDRIIGEIVGILFAGSETAANIMTEFLFEMASQPEIQAKVRQELVDFETKHNRRPQYEDITNGTTLPYFDAVMRETLRLKAVLMDIARVATRDDVIPLEFSIPGTNAKEVFVRKGTDVCVPVRDGINVDEAIWGLDAAVFKPERWLDDSLPESVRLVRAQGNMLTFGDGPKVCLGRTFALAELKIVLSTLVRHFSFEPENSTTLDFYHLGGNTVKPKIRGREHEGVQMPLRVTKV